MRGLAHEVSNAARARMNAGLRMVYFLLDTETLVAGGWWLVAGEVVNLSYPVLWELG